MGQITTKNVSFLHGPDIFWLQLGLFETSTILCIGNPYFPFVQRNESVMKIDRHKYTLKKIFKRE
jgi:hypothetical protein